MLKFLVKASVSVVLVAIFIKYCCFTPFPDDTKDLKARQILHDFFTVTESIAHFSEKLGFYRWWIYRALEKILFLPVDLPDGMIVNATFFDNVETLIITPKAFQQRKQPGPAIVFYHGGGFTINTLAIYKELLVKAAEETGFLVIAPEFRKAPEYPFPIPYEDCLKSTIKFLERANEFGVDPEKIVIVGDSAGGTFAMAVTLELVELSEKFSQIHPPSMQVLIYPTLQIMNFQLPSYRQSVQYFFAHDLLPRFWLSYLGLDHRPELAALLTHNVHVNETDPTLNEALNLVSEDVIPEKYKTRKYQAQSPLSAKEKALMDDETRSYLRDKMLDPRVAPLMTSDEMLSKLPFTHVTACGYDALRDDAILLYERMKRLGLAVDLRYLPQSPHGVATGTNPGEHHYEENLRLFADIKKYVETRR